MFVKHHKPISIRIVLMFVMVMGTFGAVPDNVDARTISESLSVENRDWGQTDKQMRILESSARSMVNDWEARSVALEVKNIESLPRTIPQISILTPSYPVGIENGKMIFVPYQLQETGNVSGTITSRTYQFFTQYDVPLSEPMGPYSMVIHVASLQTTEWNEPVHLDQEVLRKARAIDEYALVLKTTYEGISASGAKFATEASLLLLLPPAPFSKVSPANGASVSSKNLSLQWNSSVGAIDYEYCYDTINNNKCDTNWTGTYWVSTYGTSTALQDLPPGTTFYWQVRAKNMAGTTTANNGTWWSFMTCPVTPTVANINDSGPGSLRQAIADACPGGTINFDSSLSGRTITLASTLLLNKSLTIDASALSSRLTVSGNNSVTVFQVVSATVVALKGLIVTEGNPGGISNTGDLTLINDLVLNNMSPHGGGIANSGTLTIADSIISGNTAIGDGGGLFHRNGMLTITNTILANNSSRYGGGIYTTDGTVAVTNGVFSNNLATTFGGGMYNSGTMTVLNSTFSGNSAPYGGGIYHSYAGTLSISSSTFSLNSASVGGAIYNNHNLLNITNSTFVSNLANTAGGAVYNSGSATQVGTLTLTNSTFSDNSANDFGGGIYNAGTLHYSNTIVANSMMGGDCYNDSSYGTIGTNTNNLVETNGPSGYECGVPTIISDPNLYLLANNGGSTNTMALLSGSPAINGGNDATCPATDQRGVRRPQGSHCDIGAYESQEIGRFLAADFNGDGKTDVAVFRPPNGTWYISGQGRSTYGQVGDVPVPADYDGDGKDDIAVFRPSNSTWYVRGQGSYGYGAVGDIPVVADYNGDGKAEAAVFRPSNSTWYIRGIGSFVYGQAGDVPVPADYNGDGKAEAAVFRPSNSTWYIRGIGPQVYGAVGDIPVVADYNGDGQADIAVFRPSNSTWYLYGIGPRVYGTVGDLPVVGDYNGDGKADIAVFRPTNSTWYTYGMGPSVYGTVDDIPV